MTDQGQHISHWVESVESELPFKKRDDECADSKANDFRHPRVRWCVQIVKEPRTTAMCSS